MSVNWQNTDFYRELKDYECSTGNSVADNNRLNGISCDNPWGVWLASIVPQLVANGINYCANNDFKSTNTGSTTNVEKETNLNKRLGEIISEISEISDDNPDNYDNYIEELQNLQTEYPNNQRIPEIIELLKNKSKSQ